MLIANGMFSSKKGQSIIELLVAMAIFVLSISAISFLILDSYVAHRIGREETIATLLAEEGLEAARSIRDNSWEELTDGVHGIIVSGGYWAFQGSENDLGAELKDGKREVVVQAGGVGRFHHRVCPGDPDFPAGRTLV